MSNTYKDLDLTSFPEQVDAFKQWLDITASDGPTIRAYMDAMYEGNTNLANQLLAQIPSGTQKIIKATDLNKLSQAMLAVERFYKSDVKGYIQDRQTEWQALINQFDYKQIWKNGTSYQKSNLVSYIVFGVEYLYLAIANVPVNTPPTDVRYWRQITIQGQQGVSGDGLAYRFQWIASTKYTINDAVTYDGALWMATRPSQGVVPSQTSDAWKIIMTLSATTYPVQDNQPVNQIAGDLWFNTSKTPTKFYYLTRLGNPASPEDIVSGKEVYNDEGQRMVGTATGFAAQWNSDISALVWK